MTEMEMVRELRRVVAMVAQQDRRQGRAVGNIDQSKAKVRADLVSAVKERFGYSSKKLRLHSKAAGGRNEGRSIFKRLVAIQRPRTKFAPRGWRRSGRDAAGTWITHGDKLPSRSGVVQLVNSRLHPSLLAPAGVTSSAGAGNGPSRLRLPSIRTWSRR